VTAWVPISKGAAVLVWTRPTSYDSLVDGEEARIQHLRGQHNKPYWREGEIYVTKVKGEKVGKYDYNVEFQDGSFRISISSLGQLQVLRRGKTAKGA